MSDILELQATHLLLSDVFLVLSIVWKLLYQAILALV